MMKEPLLEQHVIMMKDVMQLVLTQDVKMVKLHLLHVIGEVGQLVQWVVLSTVLIFVITMRLMHVQLIMMDGTITLMIVILMMILLWMTTH